MFVTDAYFFAIRSVNNRHIHMPILFDRQKGTYKAARSVEHWVSWSVHMGREI